MTGPVDNAMGGLREALEQKVRRRAVVQIELSDPGDARRRVEAAQAARMAVVGAASIEGGDVDVSALDAEVEAAVAALAACTAQVRLAQPTWEAAEEIQARHAGPDGDVDYSAALPDLLAACAEDEALQDADWWREQLADPRWSPAEVSELRLAVMHLILNGPRAYVPKD